MRKSIVTVIFCTFLPICIEDCCGMVPEREDFDFFTPIGAFVNWSCNQEEAIPTAASWTCLVAMFKSDNYGRQGCIDANSVHSICMHEMLKFYFTYFQPNGSYSPHDHKADGILSLYPAFAEAFGNTDDPSKIECYCVAAREDGQYCACRRKEDMLNGIGEDYTLNCDGGVGNTRKVNAFLQLLLLTEIADYGTANDHSLDDKTCSVGYDYPALLKFYKLMSLIMEE
jgi:hypothetical protein